VIFSRELLFYPSKYYSFIYKGSDFLQIWKQLFSSISAHALKWGNKTYKLKKSNRNENVHLLEFAPATKIMALHTKKLKFKFLICIFSLNMPFSYSMFAALQWSITDPVSVQKCCKKCSFLWVSNYWINKLKPIIARNSPIPETYH